MKVLGSITLVPPQLRSDRHKLAGVVTVDGQPAKRMIVAMRRDTFAVVSKTYSIEETGAWEISGVPEHPERSLIVLALDDTGNYNAEVSDYISQVAPNPLPSEG